jgi:hypothetical protein
MPCFASFLNELPESRSMASTVTPEVYVNVASLVHTNVKESDHARALELFLHSDHF